MEKNKDILIKNTTIVDGTGKPPYFGSLFIQDGKIQEIYKTHSDSYMDELPKNEERTVIDGSSLITAPGFIDLHSHNDLVPFFSKELQERKLHQGVTTELVGQCGLGAAPCSDLANPGWDTYIRGVVGDIHSASSPQPLAFNKFSEYVDRMSATPLMNHYGALVSHGAVRTAVMGFSGRPAETAEIQTMCELVSEAIHTGAYGLSFGLQYMPGIFSEKEELVRLCQTVANLNGVVMVHLRNHDRSIEQALKEMISIASVTKVRLHVSHLRSYGSPVLGFSGEKLLKIVDEAINDGVKLTFDQHVYLSGSTLFTQLLPPWFTEGGAEKLKERLEDEESLRKLQKDLEDPRIHYDGWDNYAYVTGYDHILITSANTKAGSAYVGNTLGQLAKYAGLTPFAFMVKLLKEEGPGLGIVTENVFSEEDLGVLLKHPVCMIGSDSIPAGRPHPRFYGNYPLYLGKFVRERQILSMEEAVRKATLLPAQLLGLSNRGQIAPGFFGDLVLFDRSEIIGAEDYLNPTTPPKGIRHVLVNGEMALFDGKTTESRVGSFLKRR